MIPLGIRLYGVGAMAVGFVGLVWGDFALQWQPVAAWIPGRGVLAYIFAAALAIAGACVNDPKPSRARARIVAGAADPNSPNTTAIDATAARGAIALTVLYALVVIFMHGPQIFQQPASFSTWNGAAEQLALLAGGLAAYSYIVGSWTGLGRAAVIIMGICLLMFGLAHFLYLDFTASMVPAWLPGGQKFWAAATGVAHIAAGIAFLTGVKARLAAIWVTVMFGSFSVLVHLPLLLADPRAHLSWVINAINLALTGAAWAIATQLAIAGVSANADANTSTATVPAAPQMTQRPH